MIKDLAESYRRARTVFPTLLQDNLALKDGLYLRLNVDQNWGDQAQNFDQNHVIIAQKESDSQNVELLDWFKSQDYLSSLIDMQKPMDPKKQMHSNNPFTLFVKRDVFLGEKADAKFTMLQNISRFLRATQKDSVKQKWLDLNPNKKNLDYLNASEYSLLLQYLETVERANWIEQIERWYKENLPSLTNFIQSIKFSNYVKLFFDVSHFDLGDDLTRDIVMANEYKLYTIPRIFNKNDYNQMLDNEPFGLSNFNMSMNAKKPFLEHKTMRIIVPDRVPILQALLVKEASEWLLSKKKFTMHQLGYESGIVSAQGELPEGSFHVFVEGKDNEIQSFENVPFPPGVLVTVKWMNILQLKDHEGRLKDYSATEDALQKTISNSFFHGRLNGQFLTNVPPDVKTSEFTALMQVLYLQSRQAFYDWLYKGTTLSLRPMFASITLRLIEEQLLHVKSVSLFDLADALNLRWSIMILLNEKGAKPMTDQIQATITSLRVRLAGDEQAFCDNDSEFYFLAGQLGYYLVSRSKVASDKKTGELLEPFLRAKDGHQLKKRLEENYSLYKHDIRLGYQKFNRAFAMVLGYETNADHNYAREFLLAGIFADNLFYEK